MNPAIEGGEAPEHKEHDTRNAALRLRSQRGAGHLQNRHKPEGEEGEGIGQSYEADEAVTLDAALCYSHGELI